VHVGRKKPSLASRTILLVQIRVDLVRNLGKQRQVFASKTRRTSPLISIFVEGGELDLARRSASKTGHLGTSERNGHRGLQFGSADFWSRNSDTFGRERTGVLRVKQNDFRWMRTGGTMVQRESHYGVLTDVGPISFEPKKNERPLDTWKMLNRRSGRSTLSRFGPTAIQFRQELFAGDLIDGWRRQQVRGQLGHHVADVGATISGTEPTGGVIPQLSRVGLTA
jgi:hypothetical protein